jgi:hypothetical protein
VTAVDAVERGSLAASVAGSLFDALITVVNNSACSLALYDNPSIMEALNDYADLFGIDLTSLVEERNGTA